MEMTLQKSDGALGLPKSWENLGLKQPILNFPIQYMLEVDIGFLI